MPDAESSRKKVATGVTDSFDPAYPHSGVDVGSGNRRRGMHGVRCVVRFRRASR